MMKRWLVLLILSVAVLNGFVFAQNSGRPDRIGVRVVNGAGEFYNTMTGERFMPRGVNYIAWKADGGLRHFLSTALFDPDTLRADFRQLASGGYNTVRIFIDHCSTGPTCIVNNRSRGLNPDYIANIAETIRIAAEEGIYLVLTSNDIPDGGGYGEDANRGANAQFAGYRNAHYLTRQGVAAAEQYWRDIMTLLMTFDPPTEAVLGWSLLNEQWFFSRQPPLSLNRGSVRTANGQTYDLSDPAQKRAMLVDGVAHYIAVTGAVIREHDPGALVTMGFFVPQFPNPTQTGGDWYVDTEPLLGRAQLDFFDFHAYPGGDIGLEDIAENFGMLVHPEIPVLMGEVGAFRHIYASADLAAVTLQEWIAASCLVGFDGWLLWDYFGAPLSVGDAAWGALAADGLIFNALSPASQPDPCRTTGLRLANIAFRQPVTASRALPNEPASNVTDGSANPWGAGEHPPQWVEINLGGTFAVSRVTLRVAQYPAGETRHQVWALMADGSRVLLREFAQPTRDDDVLIVALDAPLSDVTGIRVDTLESPSWAAWREIEVFEGGAGEACVVRAGGSVNLRRAPTTSAEIAGTLAAGRGAVVDRRATGDDGFTWYRLPHEVWARADVVTASGDCAALPE